MTTATSVDMRVKEVRRRLAQEQGAIVKDWGGRVPVALIYSFFVEYYVQGMTGAVKG